MNTFNETLNNIMLEYTNDNVLGNTEKIYIDGIGDTVCKVDTGNNAFNVLHGINISKNGDEVEFDTIEGKRVKKKILDNATVNIGSGIKEERPIMHFNIKLGEKEYPNVKFTISDRTENSEPVLLGKEFLSGLNKLIDINKDFNIS